MRMEATQNHTLDKEPGPKTHVLLIPMVKWVALQDLRWNLRTVPIWSNLLDPGLGSAQVTFHLIFIFSMCQRRPLDS